MTERITRAVWSSCQVHDNESMVLRVVYPATYSANDFENMTGMLPPHGEASFPIVVMLGGINVNPDTYLPLAQALSDAQIATVLIHYVADLGGAVHGLSPGLDLDALHPTTLGTRPSCTILAPLLEHLEHAPLGPLAGRLDVSRVVLGGHSAGGTVALLNANTTWFPQLCGVFSYAGHTQAASQHGHPEGFMMPVGGTVESHLPVCVLGGEDDGVIAASASRYGNDDRNRLRSTFDTITAGPAALLIAREANHLSIGSHLDLTTARGFLEREPIERPTAHRSIVGAIVAFVRGVFDGDPLTGLRGSLRAEDWSEVAWLD